MAKSKKRKVKVKRFVGTSPMDVAKTPALSDGVLPVSSQPDCMDTSEIVVTESTLASKKAFLGTAGGRVVKKGPQKRKAVKLRKEKALMKAISMIDKQERRITKQELRKYGKQELKKME